MQTVEMIVLEQQSWVTLLGFAGFAVALFGYLATFKRDMRSDMKEMRTELKGDIAGLRTEVKGDIAGLRTELKGDLHRIDDRLTTLENRTYDISTRLPPARASAS